ncbi:hypothetical protein ACSBR2_028869 [Camellia fascicularis]
MAEERRRLEGLGEQADKSADRSELYDAKQSDATGVAFIENTDSRKKRQRPKGRNNYSANCPQA